MEVGIDPDAAHVITGHGLEPDRLPDPRHRGVPDAARPPYLLPPRLLALVGWIANGDNELLLGRAGAEVVCDVECKRIVAAAMLAGRRAIDVDDGFPVDRTEVEEQPAARGHRRGRKGPPVPEPLVRSDPYTRPPQLRFERERDENASFERGGPRRFARRDRI